MIKLPEKTRGESHRLSGDERKHAHATTMEGLGSVNKVPPTPIADIPAGSCCDGTAENFHVRKGIRIELGCTIEGREDNELPEQILACASVAETKWDVAKDA